jgi:hypothetical protein
VNDLFRWVISRYAKEKKKKNAQAYFAYEQVTIEELPLDV